MHTRVRIRPAISPLMTVRLMDTELFSSIPPVSPDMSCMLPCVDNVSDKQFLVSTLPRPVMTYRGLECSGETLLKGWAARVK